MDKSSPLTQYRSCQGVDLVTPTLPTWSSPPFVLPALSATSRGD